VNSGLLMPHQDVLKFILLEEFVINIKYGSARVSEHIFNFFFLETLDYNFSTS
jgi:hypothetical protein